MFSQVSVILFRAGCAWQEGLCDGEHVWWGAMHGKGAGVAGVMCGGGMHGRGHAW